MKFDASRGGLDVHLLTVDAASEDSARDLCAALSNFRAELVKTADGGLRVQVPLGGGRATIEVLSALQEHVTRHDLAPVRVEMSGRTYLLDAAGPAPGGSGRRDSNPRHAKLLKPGELIP